MILTTPNLKTTFFARHRISSDLFRSLQDDEAMCNNTRNNVAVSPELSGVTYVQGSRGVWGMPHVLQMVDSGHLESMRAVVAANEECLHADGEQSAHQGTDYVVNVYVGLSGPAVLAGKFYRYCVRIACMYVIIMYHRNVVTCSTP